MLSIMWYLFWPAFFSENSGIRTNRGDKSFFPLKKALVRKYQKSMLFKNIQYVQGGQKMYPKVLDKRLPSAGVGGQGPP